MDADVPIQIEGGQQLVDLGARLRAMGDKTIVPAFRRQMNAGTKDLRKRARDRIRVQLPHRGGLDKWAGTMPSTSVRVERDRASVKVALQKRGHDLKAMDKGIVRHPTFGHRPWKSQRIGAGWWSAAIEPEADSFFATLNDAVARAISDAATKGA